ncbi:metallophosphoesterase [Nakamurella aerolata]|uniref:Metallophosphoesterase n=1 Tax=Nakamurella aerolata TaxID=1656892 RepID=A0A849A464_9ACTN|nr:metallophosphoesterase [Nakamurella aerolata]
MRFRHLAGAALGAGALATGWAFGVEPRLYTLRRITLPLLPPGSWPIRILHLTDLHLLPRQQDKIDWVAAQAALQPDLVVLTGDTLSHRDSVAAAERALGGLLDRPGVFVRGNNDYVAPILKSPHHYWFGSSPRRARTPLPWRELSSMLTGHGWIDLDNATTELDVHGQRVQLAGVDDPYTRRDRYPLIAGQADPDAVLRVGVMHAPEPRVLDAFAADGYELLLAGHTHGGQGRLPFVGALTSNCGLDRSRARGVSRWGVGSTLHVSAGLGHSPYMPLRFCCFPEASLLTITAG